MNCYPLAYPPSRRTILCRLSATAYSIYSQLPSVSGGRLLHLQPDEALCRGKRVELTCLKSRSSVSWRFHLQGEPRFESLLPWKPQICHLIWFSCHGRFQAFLILCFPQVTHRSCDECNGVPVTIFIILLSQLATRNSCRYVNWTPAAACFKSGISLASCR
jgi:hypothetical protein